MKFRLIIDNDRDEEVVVYAHKITDLIRKVEEIVSSDSFEIIGYRNKEAVKLNDCDICCFIVEDKKLYALTDFDRFLLKCRLYQIEENINNNFIKINQSCIANINKIKSFDASISGVLIVKFSNGYTDYVSRRQLKNVKERFGLKNEQIFKKFFTQRSCFWRFWADCGCSGIFYT